MMEFCERNYRKIIDFLAECGGVYRSMDHGTCFNVIDALRDGRIISRMGDDGRLTALVAWCLITPNDVEPVRRGVIPLHNPLGTMIYISESGSTGKADSIDLRRELWQLLPKSVTGICWHSRKNQQNSFRVQRLRREI